MIEFSELDIPFSDIINNLPKKYRKSNIDNCVLKLFLNMENETKMIYYMDNIIEWTPVKLCQSVYYLVRTNNNFWVVKWSKINGFEYKYITSMIELLLDNIKSIIPNKNSVLESSSNGAYYLIHISKCKNIYTYMLKWDYIYYYSQIVI
jgi:hypothetical protein